MSAASFATTVIIGRSTNPGELGVYAIAISVLAGAPHHSGIADHPALRDPAAPPVRHAARACRQRARARRPAVGARDRRACRARRRAARARRDARARRHDVGARRHRTVRAAARVRPPLLLRSCPLRPHARARCRHGRACSSSASAGSTGPAACRPSRRASCSAHRAPSRRSLGSTSRGRNSPSAAPRCAARSRMAGASASGSSSIR